MAVPPEGKKNSTCLKEGCAVSCNNLKELQRHMKREEDHDYCDKCNYMAESWDDLIHHKINSPFVHICCKFCGEDFKTTSGRDRHVRQRHPVDQDLYCKGCNERFVRAAALIEHLEFDHCPKIRATQFKSNLQHKNIISKLLQDPEEAMAKMNESWAEAARDTDLGGGIKLGSDALSAQGGSNLIDDTTDGGAPLEDEIEGTLLRPLQPETKPRPANAPRLGERWPALPGTNKQAASVSDITSSLATMSFSDTGRTSTQGGVPLRPSTSLKTQSTHAPSTDYPSLSESMMSETTVKNGAPASKNAWGGSTNASEVLFKGAKKTPVSTDWEAALRAKDEEYERNNSNNMFRLRFWDPTHKDYNPERFFNPVIEKYCCPLPHCEEMYEIPFMLETHISTVHSISRVRCPSCLKLFKSTAALVAHCESANSNCGISRSARFGQAIDQFSGGFLGAKDEARPDLTSQDRLDKKNHKTHEVVKNSGTKLGYTKYEATFPADWSMEDQNQQKTQIGRPWDDGFVSSIRSKTAVPLSNNRKVSHTTKSIYPQVHTDFTPISQYVLDGGRISQTNQKERRVRDVGKWANLVDTEAFMKGTDEVFEEPPMKILQRSEMEYYSETQLGDEWPAMPSVKKNGK